MRRTPIRLRWQLTLSHLTAIACTLVAMIAAVLLIAALVIGRRDSPTRQPAQDAQSIARMVGGIAAHGDAATLAVVLPALADGRLRPMVPGWPVGPEAARRAEWLGPTLHDIAYIVVVGSDGQVLASSDPAGAAFAPPERTEWSALAARALAGPSEPRDLVVIRPASAPAVLAAAPILDDRGRAVAAVILAQSGLAAPGGALSVWRALAIFGAASVVTLTAASLFALLSASLVAYLLSRRLVGRLERLDRAAAALAAGDLARRVEEGPLDEVGQLARQFNTMAADLQATLRDLQAERDRVTGLLDARRELVASASHELRTPVATLRGYVESAARRASALPAALRSDLATMAWEVARLERLIEDLFTLSRAAVGRLALRPAPTEVGAIARRLVETSAPLAWQQRRVQVLAEVAAELPLALVDPDRLEQILSNLLGNALRHTPPGGLVAVVVTAEPGAVQIELRDTGEGIAPEDLPHIFERFFRVRRDDGHTGAGLGLALVRELAEAMGGSVAATSTLGQGSQFTLRLPRAPAAPRSAAAHADATR